MRTPVSTYRLQIRPGFTLQDAAETVPYLKSLGVDWIYLSPILTAEKGSDHGYDVTDPSAIDPDRGGADGPAPRSSQAARDAGMGVLVDIVPNHVGVATPARTRGGGPCSRRASSPATPRRSTSTGTSAAAGSGSPCWDRTPTLTRWKSRTGSCGTTTTASRWPRGQPQTTADDPREVHDRQHYELVGWRRADNELNYRRFFAVNSLAGIRVELPRGLR